MRAYSKPKPNQSETKLKSIFEIAQTVLYNKAGRKQLNTLYYNIIYNSNLIFDSQERGSCMLQKKKNE